MSAKTVKQAIVFVVAGSWIWDEKQDPKKPPIRNTDTQKQNHVYQQWIDGRNVLSCSVVITLDSGFTVG